MIAPMRNIFVLAFLYKGDQLLLQHRAQVDFGSGLYGFCGGAVHEGERALQAMQREIREELGLEMPEDAFELVHTLHRKGTETEFIALCFKANIAGLKPRNNEPEKYDELRFFNPTALPQNIIPAHRQIIESVMAGIPYSEHGW